MSTKNVRILILVLSLIVTPFTIAMQTPFNWVSLIELISKNPAIKIGDYYSVRIPESDMFNTPATYQCKNTITIPWDSPSLEKILGITRGQLFEAGYTDGLTAYVGSRIIYHFNVPESYCKGGGGGGAAQHSFSYIWMLIIAAILAMFAAKTFGGSFKPQTI